MSELKWIKHDGGPMPVHEDTIVLVNFGDSPQDREKEISHYSPMYRAGYWDETFKDVTEYAIVTPSPSQARALDNQEGGDHYKSMPIQPAEYMMANNIPFMEGCAIKYLTRWRSKGGVEDLRKARHFIDMLIENEEKPDGE